MARNDVGGADSSAIELEYGRTVADGTWSPDWVVLSGCSPMAFKLYVLLRLRLNRKRRDRRVWPYTSTLAAMLGLERSDSVSPYIKELQRIGAITVRGERMPRRNVYVIHDIPEPDYDGFMTLDEWDDCPDNKLRASRIRAKDQERQDRQKERRTAAAKSQVSADTGSSRYQAPPAETASADTASGRLLDTASGRLHSSREPQGIEPPPPSPHVTCGNAAGEAVSGLAAGEEEDGCAQGEEQIAESLVVAGEVLDAIQRIGGAPDAKVVRGAQRATLLGELAAALRSGWPREALQALLSGPMSDCRHPTVYGIVLARVKALGEPPRAVQTQAAPVQRQACTRGCRDGYLPEGSGTVACPDCRPTISKAQIERAQVDTVEDLLRLTLAG